MSAPYFLYIIQSGILPFLTEPDPDKPRFICSAVQVHWSGLRMRSIKQVNDYTSLSFVRLAMRSYQFGQHTTEHLRMRIVLKRCICLETAPPSGLAFWRQRPQWTGILVSQVTLDTKNNPVEGNHFITFETIYMILSIQCTTTQFHQLHNEKQSF